VTETGPSFVGSTQEKKLGERDRGTSFSVGKKKKKIRGGHKSNKEKSSSQKGITPKRRTTRRGKRKGFREKVMWPPAMAGVCWVGILWEGRGRRGKKRGESM